MPGDRWSCGGELLDRVSARGSTDFTDFSLKLRAYVYAARPSPPSNNRAAEPLHRDPTTTAMYSVIQTEQRVVSAYWSALESPTERAQRLCCTGFARGFQRVIDYLFSLPGIS